MPGYFNAMAISKLEDISPELSELFSKNSGEDFEEIQKFVDSSPTENPWSYILLGGHFGHIGIIKFLIDNKVGIILLIHFDHNFEGGRGSMFSIITPLD